MLINVPILGQRDDRWASQRLGTVNGTTIGGYGCIITCMAMLATYYGHPIFPNQEDDWLTDNQGYVQGNLYRNDAFPREFADCSFDKIISCTNTPAPLDEINSYLSLGKPVVVMVDFDHDPNDGIQTHFVLIVGKENNMYVCNDPWFGDQTNFDARYGDAAKSINQINLFSGPIPAIIAQPTPTEPTITDQTKIDMGEGFGLQEVQQIRSELHDQANQINSLTKQLADCQNTPVPPETAPNPPDWAQPGSNLFQKILAWLKK